jgi:sodium/hydrogen antiporter
MPLVTVIAVALLAGLLLSGLAARSPLSVPVVFLAVGLAAGPVGFGVIQVDGQIVEAVAGAVLFTVLLTDGQKAPLSVLRRGWRDPLRVLTVGLIGTALLVALAAVALTGLPWSVCLLLGAVLAPTDPVFAAALVGRDDVPRRLRQLLNIESGLNDGLALPAVLALAGAARVTVEGYSTSLPVLLGEVLLGLLLGVAVPAAVALLARLPGLGAEPRLLPLGPIAVGLLLYVACKSTSANPYVAAFAAGSVLATTLPEGTRRYEELGELLSELGKDVALLVFATLLTRPLLGDVGVGGWLLAAFTVLVARPLPVLVSLLGTRLELRERLTTAWFGPKGFASVVYALLLVHSTLPQRDHLLALVAAAVLVSVVAHASTDVPVAVALRSADERA